MFFCFTVFFSLCGAENDDEENSKNKTETT